MELTASVEVYISRYVYIYVHVSIYLNENHVALQRASRSFLFVLFPNKINLQATSHVIIEFRLDAAKFGPTR